MDTPSATAVVVTSPARLSWRDLIPVISLILVIITLLVGGGKVLGKVDENTQRIEKLEVRADRRDDEMDALGKQLARVDAKLDLLIQRTPPRQ